MTEHRRHSQAVRVRHIHAAAMLAVVSLIAMAAIAPRALAQGTVVVTAIPGGGWIQSLDNTAGGSTQLVTGPGPGTLGTGSLALTIATNTDLAGVEHPFLPAGIPFSDLTGGSWRTFVTGETGNPDAEPASLRFTGYQDGVFPFNGFTTLVVELVYNGGATPDVWQDTALGVGTTVWQTNTDDGFCTDTTFCTFAEFKAAYATARFFGVQVSIGTGVPAVTSYVDGVALTIAGETETFDFEVAAAATPTPSPMTPEPAPATPAATAAAAAGGGGVPDTSSGPSTPHDSGLGTALGSVAILSAVTVVIIRRRRLNR